jgi:cobalt-zinc-cadmium efflux system outer membrane protein
MSAFTPRLRPAHHALLTIAAILALQTPLHAQAPASQSSSSLDQPPADYAASIHIPDPRQPVPARSGAYTLQQVIDEARAKNLTLLAAERNLRAVKAQEIQAGVRVNPNVGVAAQDITEPGSENNPYSYAIQVSRLFERGNKREWRLDNARANSAQTQAQLEDTTRQTILAVKTAFTNMLMAKASLQLASESLKEFQHEVSIATDRYKAGDLAKIDFERLDLQLASFESDESNNVVALRQASDQLQTLMGVDTPGANFDIVGDVVPPTVTQTQSALLQAALDKRPDYAAAKFAIAAAEANQKLAYANGTTDPTLEGEFDITGPERSAGFQVNIPLRIFDRNQGNKKTASFQAEASRFTAAAAHNQVISDVDQTWVNYEQSKRLSDRYTQHYLDETTDVLSIAQFAFEHGGIALIDYLDAVRDTRVTNAAALSAYQQTWLAIHQLSAASASELIP